MRSRLEYDLAWGALKNWTERTHLKPVCRYTGQRRPRFVFTEWIRPGESWIMWGAATRVGPIVVAPPGVVLLWALACEVDDRGATLTGDRVCRACSGRGEAWVWGRSDRWGHIDGTGAVGPTISEWSTRSDIIHAFVPGDGPVRERWAWRCLPCRDGPTRPDTVSLAWLVSHLAAQRSPIVNDWPDQWRVNRDQADATGDDSWQAQWWRAFEIWITAGIAPGADDLAGLLRALTPERAWAHEAIVQGGTDEDVAQAVMGQIAHLAQADHQRSVYQSFVSTATREDLDRMMALADVARIERETITPSEVRAQRFMDDDG